MLDKITLKPVLVSQNSGSVETPMSPVSSGVVDGESSASLSGGSSRATSPDPLPNTDTQPKPSAPRHRRGVVYVNPKLLKADYLPPSTGEVPGSGYW